MGINESSSEKTTIQITKAVRDEFKRMKTGQMTFSEALKKLIEFFKQKTNKEYL